MSNPNFPTFRGLLRGAICTRTQAQFANESGISAEHLNRMLNADNIHRPSKQTLHKIAAAAKNGITYQVLKDALDNEDPNFNPNMPDAEAKLKQARADFKPSFSERAHNTMKELTKVIHETMQYPFIAPSVSDTLDRIIQTLSTLEHVNSDSLLDISYELNQPRPYCCKRHTYAFFYQSVFLTMADRQETASSRMIIYYTEIKSNSKRPDETDYATQYIIQNISCKLEDIMDLFGMPPAAIAAHKDAGDDALEEALNDEYYLSIQPVKKFQDAYHGNGASPEERLLDSIFGTPTRISQTIDGFGFWLEDMPAFFHTFVEKHMDLILQPYLDEPDTCDALRNSLETAVRNKDMTALTQAFQLIESTSGYTDADCLNDHGWGAAIAVVMEAETGFPFRYKDHASDLTEFSNLSEHDCIILSEEDQDALNIQRETLLNATAHYARELGIPTMGDILFTGVETKFRKPKTYKLRLDKIEYQDEETEDTIDYSKDFTAGEKPTENGIYAVKLKDGRPFECAYLVKHDAWIRYNREWSDLVATWCPTPLRTDAPAASETDGE